MSAKKIKTPSAKERVRAMYPLAACDSVIGGYRIAEFTWDDGSSWSRLTLGYGATKDEAWTSAARNLEVKK